MDGRDGEEGVATPQGPTATLVTTMDIQTDTHRDIGGDQCFNCKIYEQNLLVLSKLCNEYYKYLIYKDNIFLFKIGLMDMIILCMLSARLILSSFRPIF